MLRKISSMHLIGIPAIQDNYIWILSSPNGESLIIDPGVASPVLTYLKKNLLTPKAILLTHHHNDHIGGVSDIVHYYPNIPVYGPLETINKGCTQLIIGGDKLTLLGMIVSVLYVPGHTIGHIAYYMNPYLFCGDTLFSAGCGRIFEGTPEQMYSSLQLITKLPDETLICCSHEYTESNLEFAKFVLSNNQDIKEYQKKVRKLRLKQQPSVPTLLRVEKKINPFLRCYDNDLLLNLAFEKKPDKIWKIFSRMRDMKDQF